MISREGEREEESSDLTPCSLAASSPPHRSLFFLNLSFMCFWVCVCFLEPAWFRRFPGWSESP